MPPDSRKVPRSDADLIGCSRTEPEEFTELFRRDSPHIQRYVTRRLGSAVLNGSGADDIVAETFLLASGSATATTRAGRCSALAVRHLHQPDRSAPPGRDPAVPRLRPHRGGPGGRVLHRRGR